MNHIDQEPAPAISADYVEAFRLQWCPDMPRGQKPAEISPDDIRRQIREQRMAAFRELCPPEFAKKIDRALLPNPAAWDAADAWDGSAPGLWLWSTATGRAKSRMLWRHFGRLHVEHGKDVVRMTGIQLGEEYFRFHMAGNPREFYRRVLRHDVVMIDDLDKVDFAQERTVRMLRDLLDSLYESHKPVLITANEDQAEIERRVGLSGGRRIRAIAREVAF